MRASTLTVFAVFCIVAPGFSGARYDISFVDQTSTRLIPPYEDDTQQKHIEAGDFNQDGWPDVCVVRKTPFYQTGALTHYLFMNEPGDGVDRVLYDRTATYAPGLIETPSAARDLEIVDVNGDTFPDLLIGNTFSQPVHLYLNLGNDGGGNWLGLQDVTATNMPPLALLCCGVAAGDLDGDGDRDIYLSNYGGQLDKILINNGAGVFTDESTARLGPNGGTSFGTGADIADFNGDGQKDIGRLKVGRAEILYNEGAGFFTGEIQQLVPGDAYMTKVGDVDLDGDPDMVVVTDSNDVIAYNDGVEDGRVVWGYEGLLPESYGFGGMTHLGDFNNDGYPELMTSFTDVQIPTSNPARLWQHSGARPAFTAAPQFFGMPPEAYYDFGFLDLNGDGKLDIVAGTSTLATTPSGYRVWMQP